MKKALVLLPALLVVLTGCNSDSTSSTDSAGAKTAAGGSTSSSDSSTSSKPNAPASATPTDTTGSTAGTTTTGSTNTGSTATADKKPAPGKLPAELMHEGYDYSGLAFTKPMDMELKISGANAQDLTGSQTTTLDEVKDGKATYTVTRTGGLENVGTDTITLEKDGVYNQHNSIAKMSPHAMILPADPKPGMSWTVHVSSDSSQARMELDLKFKILGKGTVTTKTGTYKDALILEQDGTGQANGKKVRTVEKDWFVKGLGNIKSELTTYLPGNKTQTVTIEETHH